MQPEEYQPDAPGKVVRSTMGHWTFLPDHLPPELRYTTELVRELSEADRALGELTGAGGMLPNPYLLIQPFIRKEAVLSSKIEGTVTELDQLFLFEAAPDDGRVPADAQEVGNYVKALKFGLTAIRDGQPFSLKMIRELHQLLLKGVGDERRARPGRFREIPVLIGHVANYKAARFVPPCHTRITALLHDFIAFLRDGRQLPVVVQVALMHYQFETIHPFNDGNGRVGRLLVTLMLCERGVLPEPLLYLSAYFEKNRQEYYDRLLDVSRKADWNGWVRFLAAGVAEQSRDAILRIRRLLALWDEFKAASMARTKSVLALKLIDELFLSPYITMSRASVVLNVAFKSAAKVVAVLEEIGILREITGTPRNRIYRADRIFRLLDDPLPAMPE